MAERAQSKQRKPWYRPRNVFLALFGMLLVIALWGGYWVRWAYTAKPTIAVDYRDELVNISASAQPDGPNAWPLLIRAIQQTESVSNEVMAMNIERRSDIYGPYDRLVDFWELSRNLLYPDDVEPERTALRLLEVGGTFDLLDQARHMPRAVCTVYNDTSLFMLETHAVSNVSPEFDFYYPRQLAGALAGRARIAADVGDYQTSVESFAEAMFIADAFSNQPLLNMSQVGEAIRNSIMFHIVFLLHEHDLPANVARDLRELMMRDNRVQALDRVLDGVHARLLDHVQRTFTDDGDGNGRYLPAAHDVMENERLRLVNNAWTDAGYEVDEAIAPKSVVSRRRNLNTFDHAGRRQTTEDIEHIIRDIRDVLRDDQSNWLEKQVAIEDILGRQSIDVPFVTPPLETFAQQVAWQATVQTRQRAVIILTAIEEYEATHNQLPMSLDDLVPAILEDLPKVPITGNDFLYRVLDEPDAHGRRFLLYIPGAGGVDNDGRVAEVRIRDILTDDGIGSEYDYILNRVRE